MMLDRPEVMWFDHRDSPVAQEGELVTSFGNDMVKVKMRVEADGSYSLGWFVHVGEDWNLPQVELLVAKVATVIIDEPRE
jgi:hypothetical protein